MIVDLDFPKFSYFSYYHSLSYLHDNIFDNKSLSLSDINFRIHEVSLKLFLPIAVDSSRLKQTKRQITQ